MDVSSSSPAANKWQSSTYFRDALHAGYHHPSMRFWNSDNTSISANNLSYPIFVLDIDGEKREIKTMPEQYQWSVDRLPELIDPLIALGLSSVLLFGALTSSDKKDSTGSIATDTDGPVRRAIRFIKSRWPDLHVIADVCLCQYTDTGHCGIIKTLFSPILPNDRLQTLHSDIDPQASASRIADIALHYAVDGADMVAPSDMMDGRIAAIKLALNSSPLLLRRVAVMSYSAKFASCGYGPFRDAANSAPSKGDRKSYQLPVGSSSLAKRALARDYAEGSDVLMVKPGYGFLDIVRHAADTYDVPISVYDVSGDYIQVYAAGKMLGAIDFESTVRERMTNYRRSGANMIITYFTPFLLELISKSEDRCI